MRTLITAFALLLGLAADPAAAEPPAPALEFTPMPMQVARVRVRADVSFDDAVESLKLRANEHNLKFVGVNALYKEIEALTGKPARRMEIFSFCDGLVAQQMIAADPLLISFMPCRIAVLEDTRGARWVIAMLMGDGQLSALPPDARKSAERIMAAMKDMMVAAATGDL